MKEFVTEAAGAASHGCRVDFIPHADPELVVLGALSREVERVSLQEYTSLDQLQRTREEIVSPPLVVRSEGQKWARAAHA